MRFELLVTFFTLILFYAATLSFALQSYVLGCALKTRIGVDFLSYIHHLEKPDAPMSFSGSSLKSPVKGDSSLLKNSDSGGDVRVADQDDLEVNLENSAQVFDSDSPSSC